MSFFQNKFYYFSLLLCSFFVLLVGCSEKEIYLKKEDSKTFIELEKNKLGNNISEQTEQIESTTSQLEYLQKQNDYFIDVIRELIQDFSDEEMLAFAQNHIHYLLEVNGEPVPKDGNITGFLNEVTITLTEENLGYPFLDPEWQEKGKLSGNYFDHLMLDTDEKNWTEIGTDGTVHTSRGYQKEVQSGDKITFTITDELKERLNLSTNIIKITISS